VWPYSLLRNEAEPVDDLTIVPDGAAGVPLRLFEIQERQFRRLGRIHVLPVAHIVAVTVRRGVVVVDADLVSAAYIRVLLVVCYDDPLYSMSRRRQNQFLGLFLLSQN